MNSTSSKIVPIQCDIYSLGIVMLKMASLDT